MNGKPLHRASKNKTCSYLFYLTSVTRPKGPSNLTFTVDVITLMTFFCFCFWLSTTIYK